MVVLHYDAAPSSSARDEVYSQAAFYLDPSLAPSAQATPDDAPHVQAHSQERVAYYFPKGVGEYHYGERHPMKPARLTLTNSLVLGYGLHHRMQCFTPRVATREELEWFHDADYVDFLSR